MKRQMLTSKCWSLLAVLVVSLCTVFIAACGSSSSHEDKGTVALKISTLDPVLDKSAYATKDDSYVGKIVADFYEAKDGKKASDKPTFTQTKEVKEGEATVTFTNISCKTYYMVANIYGYIDGGSEKLIMSPSYIVTVKANNIVTAEYPISTGMTLNIENSNIAVGASTACDAIITLVDGTELNANNLVEWSLTDSSVGTLSYDAENNAETFTGKKAGSTNVTASYDFDYGSNERSATITVSNV